MRALVSSVTSISPKRLLLSCPRSEGLGQAYQAERWFELEFIIRIRAKREGQGDHFRFSQSLQLTRPAGGAVIPWDPMLVIARNLQIDLLDSLIVYGASTGRRAPSSKSIAR